jgi:hypothetical protein
VYLGHGFQTQGTSATVVDLKVRLELTCVPGPWISDPRYGARVLRVLGPMVQRVKTNVQLGSIVARIRGPLTARFHRSLHT